MIEFLGYFFLAFITLALIGMFGKLILFSLVFLFVGYSIANSKLEIEPKTTDLQITTVPEDSKRKEYIAECMRYGIQKVKCENIWDDKN
jgi:hypothetical protein